MRTTHGRLSGTSGGTLSHTTDCPIVALMPRERPKSLFVKIAAPMVVVCQNARRLGKTVCGSGGHLGVKSTLTGSVRRQ